MLPMAAGAARGSSFQEGTIRVLLMSAALSLVAVADLVGPTDVTTGRIEQIEPSRRSTRRPNKGMKRTRPSLIDSELRSLSRRSLVTINGAVLTNGRRPNPRSTVNGHGPDASSRAAGASPTSLRQVSRAAKRRSRFKLEDSAPKDR